MAREKEKLSNIFEAAGGKSGKKEGLVPSNLYEKAPKGPLLTDQEIDERYKKLKELHNMLADKIDTALSDKNISKKQFKEFFESPKNFSDSQWRMIQEEKAETEKKLSELIPKKQKEKKEGKDHSKMLKPKKMQTKSRWMPM